MIEVFLPLVTGKIGSATFSLIARDFIFPLVITFSQNLERTNSFMWGMRAQKPIAFAFVNLRDAPFFLKVLYNLFFFPKCHGNDNCHDRSMLFFMTSV